jgi:hypothetical protein
MSDSVMFQMWDPLRRSLINEQIFYFEQSNKRLLSQFENIETEADRATYEYLESPSGYFDPDSDDPGNYFEAAEDAGIEFYVLLSEMREQTRLSVVAGMFHLWDKQLRDWLMRQIGLWHNGIATTKKIWEVDFFKIMELLESFGWNFRSTDYFRTLDACRLVVNVYKHGEGKSREDLSQNYPEYLVDPFKALGRESSEIMTNLEYTHLKVSDEQIQAFSAAIVSFWRDVPANTFESNITNLPVWFKKAVVTDRSAD